MLQKGNTNIAPMSDKLRLQTCEIPDFHLARESIKIPIFSAIRNFQVHKQKQAAQPGIGKLDVMPAKVPCNRSESPNDHINSKYYERSLLLRGPIKVQYEATAPEDAGLYRKMSLPIRINRNQKNNSIIYLRQPQPRVDRKHKSNANPIQQYILPSLNLNLKISKPRPNRLPYQKSTLNNEIWRRNERRAQQSYNKKKTKQRIKSCYQPQDSISIDRNFQISRRPSSRIKTEVQIENQFMLQRLLTVKPSKDLNRHFLQSRFQKHKYYQQIRVKKDYDTRRKTLHNSALKRSKSITNDVSKLKK